MKEFLKARSVAKIYCMEDGFKHFLGEIIHLHRNHDEYVVLDRRNGETHYFESWHLAHRYVRSQICWHAYYVCGKKEFYDESVFTL